MTEASRERLLAHPWPGNVRELDNVVQRALILILEELDEQDEQEMEFVSVDRSYGGDLLGSELSELKQQEHQIILDTLQDCNGSRKAVADRLGISPHTLRYKLAQMREVGIDLPA